MALIDDIKTALRVDGNASDSEITDLIAAAKLDLKIAGVNSTDETDKLIKRAITLYCKANYGYDSDAERLEKSYVSLKQHLSLSTEYAEVVVT